MTTLKLYLLEAPYAIFWKRELDSG